jgi:hypothetical protein
MRYFLVEIPIPQGGPSDSARAAEALRTAQSRLSGSATVPRALFAGISQQDGRLICLIEASAAHVARALVALALLPMGRIREISSPTCPARLVAPAGTRGRLSGSGGPGCDLDPGVEPELVEDVGDVGLHRALGEE